MINLNLVTGKTRFECQRCAKCCSLDVMLSEREMRELAPNVDKAWRTTIKKKVGSRFVCRLLECNSCTIYPGRPLLCRVYPFFAVPSDQLALLGEPIPPDASAIPGNNGGHFFFIYDDSCPGMGKGEPPDLNSILETTLRHLSEMEAGSL